MHLIICGSDKYQTFQDSLYMILITYIIGHYNPLVRITDLVFRTTYVVCVNFIQSTPNDRFFRKLFMAVLFYSQSFRQKSVEKKSPKKYFFCILFSYLAWGSKPSFTSNKPTYYSLDYSNFNNFNNIPVKYQSQV